MADLLMMHILAKRATRRQSYREAIRMMDMAVQYISGYGLPRDPVQARFCITSCLSNDAQLVRDCAANFLNHADQYGWFDLNTAAPDPRVLRQHYVVPMEKYMASDLNPMVIISIVLGAISLIVFLSILFCVGIMMVAES